MKYGRVCVAMPNWCYSRKKSVFGCTRGTNSFVKLVNIQNKIKFILFILVTERAPPLTVHLSMIDNTLPKLCTGSGACGMKQVDDDMMENDAKL